MAKTGLLAKAGVKIMKAFIDAGLKYNMIYKGKPTGTSTKPLDIRHSKIGMMHRAASGKNPSLTPTQISDKMAGYFQHSNDINQDYFRRMFGSMGTALAKKGVPLSTIEEKARPNRRAPEQKKKPSAKKAPAPKPAPKPAPEAPPPKPTPMPPVIVTENRRSAHGRIPSRRLFMCYKTRLHAFRIYFYFLPRSVKNYESHKACSYALGREDPKMLTRLVESTCL